MLTQGSQGMRYCNDTERRVSVLQMLQYFLMVVIKCSHDLSRYFCGRRRGLIRRAREGLLERNNNLVRAANEMHCPVVPVNRLFSLGLREERAGLRKARGPQTSSATSLSASSSSALPTGACSPASPVSEMWPAFMHAFTHLKDLTVVLFASYSRTNCPVCRHPLYSQDSQ